uniref:Myb/SANT-like DNA-binding domain-containing protein n=1 Tax=Laticauda laticaudata TaxID=8630 RepID=A0A8C5RYC3_LATLA
RGVALRRRGLQKPRPQMHSSASASFSPARPGCGSCDWHGLKLSRNKGSTHVGRGAEIGSRSSMDFRGKKYERGTNWSDPEVVELLHLWADESVQAELESCLRNQHVFNRIAEVLREKGIHRTGDQCREKIKKMKLEYRRIKDNHKAPRGGRTWKFYEVMDRVLASRPPLVYRLPGGVVESYHPHLGPSSALTFPPSQTPEQMEIKCEEVDSEDQCLMPEPLPSLTTYQPGGSAEEFPIFLQPGVLLP